MNNFRKTVFQNKRSGLTTLVIESCFGMTQMDGSSIMNVGALAEAGAAWTAITTSSMCMGLLILGHNPPLRQ
jgi:hypothetical protein